MEILDKIEVGYDRNKAVARLYDGKEQECTVYTMANKMKKTWSEDKPPTERYLDIIWMGCEHFGVKPEYIQWLKDHEKQPRTKPEDFKAYTLPEDCPHYTREQIEENNGLNGKPLWGTINGKVREWHGDLTGPAGKIFLNLRAKSSAMDFNTSKVLFDPKYGTFKDANSMTREFCANIEDMSARSPADDPFAKWTVIGTFD